MGVMMNNAPQENQMRKSQRDSNIELLRIIAMLLIVAAHYAVNGTVMWKILDPVHPTVNTFFMHLWGMWGKMAINVFVLITGYFMCMSKLTVRRYCKILFEVIFYSWITWFVLCMCGYEVFSWGGVWKRLSLYFMLTSQNRDFIPAFMWMYLTIPAMNIYLKATDKRNLYSCISVMLCLFSICGTFLNANVYHHVFWYMTLYLIGAAIRMHPFQWMGNNRFCLLMLLLVVVMSWASVVGIDLVAMRLGHPIRDPYYYVRDSHKVLAIATALFMFLVFKNWKLPHSRFINGVASTTFGVLLIHAASEGMRKWLWGDFVNVPHAYQTFSLSLLFGYSLFVTLGVFTICSGLDFLRIRFLERPIFNWLDKLSIFSK